MKKVFLLILALSLFLSACVSSNSANNKIQQELVQAAKTNSELQQKVMDLEKENGELKKAIDELTLEAKKAPPQNTDDNSAQNGDTAASEEDAEASEANTSPSEKADDSSTNEAKINEKAIGFITKLYKKDNTTYIDIDYIQFFMGDEAVEEAKKDNNAVYDEERKSWYVDDDYYIRNVNKKIRTFPIATSANIRAASEIGNLESEKDYTPQEFVKVFKDYLPYHIEVKDGLVIKITEQYLP